MTPCQYVRALLPPPSHLWMEHIQRGTRATDNVRLGLDLSALMEAAYRSASSSRVVRLDELSSSQTVR